jgi:general stress protein 26
MAVWGVWVDDIFYFSTGARSRKTRNLAKNPRCVVCTQRADNAVIVEGIASRVRTSSIPKRVASKYSRKYKSELDPNLGPIYAVRPITVFGFIEAADEFSGAATRWTFPST